MDSSGGLSFGWNFVPDKSILRNNETLMDLYFQRYHNMSLQNPSPSPNVALECNQSFVENTTETDSLNGCGVLLEEDSWSNCISTNHFVAQTPTPLFQFLVNGVGISILALPGLIGNLLSAIVLSRPQMKSSVSCLLLGLTFCDTLLISVSIFVFSLPFLSHYVSSPLLWKYEHIYFGLWVPFLYPISITAQTGSVYLTLAVTIERYIAVCHSLKARYICTWGRARVCVALVIFFSILYNLPRWWEVLSKPLCEPVNNMTIYMNEKSAMRDNPIYVTVYINWSYLVVMYLVPFSGLVVFNLAIYRQVRKANRERQQLTKLQRREMGLATMLLCVVVVFLLCNVLPLVNNILESFYYTSVDQLVALSNFLVVVNSSANFVIYCTCGERFRRLLIRLCQDFLSCRLLTRQTRNDYRANLYRKSPDFKEDFEETSASPASLENPTGSFSTPAADDINEQMSVKFSRKTNDRRVQGTALYRVKTTTCNKREVSSNKTVPMIDANVRESQGNRNKHENSYHQRNNSISTIETPTIPTIVGVTTAGVSFGPKRISISSVGGPDMEQVDLEMKNLHLNGT